MNKIFFGCIVLLLMIGCNKGNNDNNSSNRNASDIFPDKVGDSWVYLVNDTMVYRTGGQSDSISQYHVNVSVIDTVQLPESIDGIQLPGGTTANIWVYTYPDHTDTNYVFQTADTVVFVDIN